jgi:cytochrome-b5 reductase
LLVSVSEDDCEFVRPYTSVSLRPTPGSFEVLVKRYDQWGVKASRSNNPLYTDTDHSYRPPGRVSNHIHSLGIGATLRFRFSRACAPRLEFPYAGVQSITMVAVGIGVAPMVNIISAFVKLGASWTTRLILLYGVREVKDVLFRQELEQWREANPHRLKVVYCIGSRWANVHLGAKTKEEYVPPPEPEDFSSLPGAELGWVNEDKLRRHAFPPVADTRVFVCGLPGVYDKLCGPRLSRSLEANSALDNLGYDATLVIKF